MWSPTHIQVTVVKAKGLLTKGKNGTNNCFVTIGLGKEKYQTSVKDKSEQNVSWNEECELKIPDKGNRAELVLICLHRNNIGIDEFLGQVALPLNEMDVYDRPRSKWFKLESKPGKEKKNKDRGELEVRISFIVKSGSLTDISKKDKHKSSIGQLASSVGGSLLSIGTIEKRKGIKKFAKSLGSKMHLNKKKNKDGDDLSYSGSFASIGTPNSHRYGQTAGEADPGVISEDEDEFVFDNLSHKSSGSSLNIRSGLQAPNQNFAPHTPSPLLGNSGKAVGKQLSNYSLEEDNTSHNNLENFETNISDRANTLPAPSKPPRTPLQAETPMQTPPKVEKKDDNLNEWESKLYGKHLDIGSSDSLKRRSWELARVPLPKSNESTEENVKETTIKENNANVVKQDRKQSISSTSSSSSSDSEHEEIPIKEEKVITENKVEIKDNVRDLKQLKLETSPVMANISLSSPDEPKKNFHDLNSSFAKYEHQNSRKVFDTISDNKLTSQDLINSESLNSKLVPQALPRNSVKITTELSQPEENLNNKNVDMQNNINTIKSAEIVKQAVEKEKEKETNNDQNIHLNGKKEEENLPPQRDVQQQEITRREAKRREEDQRILNFVKRSTSVEAEDSGMFEKSPKEQIDTDKAKEKRISKFKYYNKRDKSDDNNMFVKPSNERIIIGHEKSATHAERRSEMTAALSKKYEGKSREELMLIANGMENEALTQRQRVKELEDYLDNLLLRVMETHPKILQNPYSQTTPTKRKKWAMQSITPAWNVGSSKS
ncbi:rab11 family-interacting protein 1-like isoform X2 [Teleopsis dalmanni]|uniref:rab11 family-interacting protein 1-like isoform X2 n=1 Tax=Teleopsis dalmanni TaxID=139649 RepID=UPI0018CF60E9|nr:rab11 family-interacting protein 1-like isoform X2 [Teleopsis dalmanni]